MSPFMLFGAAGLAKSAVFKLVLAGAVLAVTFVGAKIIWDLQASAARKVKLQVMEQVARNNSEVARKVAVQRNYEDELRSEQRELSEAARHAPTTDIENCLIGRLRCEPLPSS